MKSLKKCKVLDFFFIGATARRRVGASARRRVGARLRGPRVRGKQSLRSSAQQAFNSSRSPAFWCAHLFEPGGMAPQAAFAERGKRRLRQGLKEAS